MDEISALGSQSMSNTVTPSSSVSQEEFIELFVQQLRTQDPLEPMDNDKFLSNLAIQSQLQISQDTYNRINDLTAMTASTQGVQLLGKKVALIGSNGLIGQVDAVQFTANGVALTVDFGQGSPISGLPMSDVTLVEE